MLLTYVTFNILQKSYLVIYLISTTTIILVECFLFNQSLILKL